MTATRTLSRRMLTVGAVILIGLLAAGLAGYGLATLQTSTDPEATPGDEREVLYWYDPMRPDQHFDAPGQSPFMDMPLVPRYADEVGAEGGVRIDPSVSQSLGARLATVVRGSLSRSVSVPGVLEFNERDVARVQARQAGYVERAYALAPGDYISRGAPIADVLVPQWAGAQAEFLALRQLADQEILEAGRERLRLIGMPADLIAAVERSGSPRPVVTLRAPTAGVVTTLNVRAGMSLAAGETLAEITGISPIWIAASVPEAHAADLRVGQSARVRIDGLGGAISEGRVVAILPQVDADSRTLEARIEAPNPSGRLRAGMFATVEIVQDDAPTVLLLPDEAVIRTGQRNIVVLALPDGRFQAAEVRAGRSAGGQTEIIEGLAEGQRVVSSAQFLLDSEASLAGVEVRPLGAAPPEAGQDPDWHRGQGRVELIERGEVTLSHGPITSLGWAAMTMPFRLTSPDVARGVEVGDQVDFWVVNTRDGPAIARIAVRGSRR